METILIILKIFGLGILGALLYAGVTVWKKVKTEGFNGNKFFNENKYFWAVCIGLNLLLAITIAIVPEAEIVLHALGFAVDAATQSGYVLLGIALATGSDKTAISGKKTIKSPN